jgi:DNA-binding transcriptional regulator WhiA
MQISKIRLGGLRRIELHGNPGTHEGRSKGGKKTISLFKNNPALAKRSRFVIRKEINYPRRSVELAELVGVILGDGGLPGNHQLTISFNKKTDKEYLIFLGKILKKLFSVNYHVHFRKNCNGADIVVSSTNLVKFLLKQGLIAGNKVKNQVDIPKWIYSKTSYQKACLRGLIDTDGSFYCHRYNVNGKEYVYLKLCFANRSKPLLCSVLEILRKFNFEAFLHGDQVFIYSKQGISKYFEEIGSHNFKHLNKFSKFLDN